VRTATAALCLSALAATQAAAGKTGLQGPVQLNEKRCTPPSAPQVGWLPQDFRRYIRFVKLCPVSQGRSSAPVIYVASVWSDDYYAGQPGTPAAEAIPLPVVLAADGRRLGILPAPFPGEGAISTTVVFSGWRAGWPHRIAVSAETAAVGDAPTYAPISWNARARQFAPSGEKTHGRQR
jgi:hypothetical protein